MFHTYRVLFLALEKVQTVNHSSSDSDHPTTIPPSHKISHFPNWGSPLPRNTISKTLNCPFAPKEDFWARFPKWLCQFGQNGQKLHKITKLSFFGQKSEGRHGRISQYFGQWDSGRDLPSPPH